jgi:hypothetical protein
MPMRTRCFTPSITGHSYHAFIGTMHRAGAVTKAFLKARVVDKSSPTALNNCRFISFPPLNQRRKNP